MKLLIGCIALIGSTVWAATPALADEFEADCEEDSGALVDALAAAPPGGTIEVEGRCVGTFLIEADVVLEGDDDAVLDGGGSGPVVTVASGVTAVMKDLTVTGGADSGPTAVGGIENRGDLTIVGSVIRGNSAVASLAGPLDPFAFIFVVAGINNAGNLTVHDSTVRHNTATVNVDGAADPTGANVLSVSGVNNGFGAAMTLDRSDVRKNDASINGTPRAVGVRLLTGTLYGTFSAIAINDSMVRKNVATATRDVAVPDAGLAYANPGIDSFEGSFSVSGTTVKGNRASATSPTVDYGGGFVFAPGISVGGIYMEGDYEPTILGSTVAGNSAFASGSAVGGIDVHRVFAETRIEDTTVRRNHAESQFSAVGGIYHNQVGDLYVEGTSVTRNSASEGAVVTAIGGLFGGTFESGGVPGENTFVTNSSIGGNQPVNCNFADPACAAPNA